MQGDWTLLLTPNEVLGILAGLRSDAQEKIRPPGPSRQRVAVGEGVVDVSWNAIRRVYFSSSFSCTFSFL